MPDSTAARLLAAVDSLAPDACGAFVVELDGEHVGSVLIERNQVCWAAALRLRRRLLDLLRESLTTMLGPAELEALVRRCAVDGRRIGEELVARSMVEGNVLRAAIKQHTIESLVALPERLGEQVHWAGHRAQGYQPRFTFAPIELLVGMNAKLYAAEALGAELGLAVLDAATPGAAFARDDDGAPIAVRLSGAYQSIAAVMDLGTWADAAFGATPGFSPQVLRRAVAATGGGEVTVAWRTSRLLLHVAVIRDREVLERVLTILERRGYPAVLSRRALGSSTPTRRDGLGVVDGNA